MNDVFFARALSSVMLDNKYDRFVKNRKTGKLDGKSLYKINHSPKLFKRREARKNKHYAVTLVVDGSGSMDENGKIQMAASAAQKLSNHLHKMEIPHSVVLFSNWPQEVQKFGQEIKNIEGRILATFGYGSLADPGKYRFIGFWENERKGKKSGKKDQNYHRYLGHADLHKEPGEQFSNWEKKRAELSNSGIESRWNSLTCAGTQDGEALAFARKKILKQEGKKIIIMLSDGESGRGGNYESTVFPGETATEHYIDDEVKKTLKAGIELYAVGVMDDKVNRHYPPRRTCTINDLSQLYPHIIKLIRLNLKRG